MKLLRTGALLKKQNINIPPIINQYFPFFCIKMTGDTGIVFHIVEKRRLLHQLLRKKLTNGIPGFFLKFFSV